MSMHVSCYLLACVQADIPLSTGRLCDECRPVNQRGPSPFFWDNYLKKIHKKGVKPPFDRWFVKRAEDYIATSSGKRLGEHLSEDLESYLRETGRKRGLKDWQYLFPSGRISADPRSGKLHRHHVHENGLQKAVNRAADQSGIRKRVNTHCLRMAWT